jgi:excisionase family DNA binding protein
LDLRSSQSGRISNGEFKNNEQENMTELKLLSIEAASTRLSLGRSTVYDLIKKGEFKAVYIGTRRLITSTEIDRYIQNLEQRNYHYGDQD